MEQISSWFGVAAVRAHVGIRGGLCSPVAVSS
jgi:hypothetical protein